MIRIVCDTNIIISAFIFPGGPPEEIFRGIIMQDYRLGISEHIIEEFRKVLIKKFTWPKDKINEITELILRNSVTVSPTHKIIIIRDEPDNRILECAEEFKANYIISGDKHILKLKTFKRTKIMTANAFLKEIS